MVIFYHTIPYWKILDQIWINWIKLDQIGSNFEIFFLEKHVVKTACSERKGSYWIKSDQILKKPFLKNHNPKKHVVKKHGLKRWSKNMITNNMVLRKTSSWKRKLLKKAICEQFGIDFQSCSNYFYCLLLNHQKTQSESENWTTFWTAFIYQVSWFSVTYFQTSKNIALFHFWFLEAIGLCMKKTLQWMNECKDDVKIYA